MATKQVTQKYKFAVIATDVVIFTVQEKQLKVLLITMNKKPFKGMWAMPGGLIGSHEDIDEAAHRILTEKTGVKEVYLEQLATFGDVGRDPFGRVVSVAYFAVIPPRAITEKGARWHAVAAVPPLAYDHADILKTAVQRVRQRLAYSSIVSSLLPSSFTLTDLQQTYEVVLGEPLDKRNFRKRLLQSGLVMATGKKRIGRASRPAALYRFTS